MLAEPQPSTAHPTDSPCWRLLSPELLHTLTCLHHPASAFPVAHPHKGYCLPLICWDFTPRNECQCLWEGWKSPAVQHPLSDCSSWPSWLGLASTLQSPHYYIPGLTLYLRKFSPPYKRTQSRTDQFVFLKAPWEVSGEGRVVPNCPSESLRRRRDCAPSLSSSSVFLCALHIC